MPPRIRPSTVPSSLAPPPSIQTHCRKCLHRAFSSTPVAPTKLRREMFAWLNGPGENFRYPLPDSTNYLSAYDKRGILRRKKNPPSNETTQGPDTADARALEKAAVTSDDIVEKESERDLKPFPLNDDFVSQSILSEELRQEIWKRVKMDGKSVRMVSVEMGVDMRRVGAVVRLVEVEKKMKAEGKTLALPYARAIHSMVPTTPYNPATPTHIQPHESINDLPVHALTSPQLFYPTSESRAFNRVDAGRVFSAAPRLPSHLDPSEGGEPSVPAWRDTVPEVIGKPGHEMHVLKPADSRIPHPQLIAYEQDKRDPAVTGNARARMERHKQRLLDDVVQREAERERKRKAQEARTTRIETDRWQFIVKQVKATRMGTGLDGRGTGSPGYRYGVPAQDRKRAQVKIPTKVEV